MTGSFMWRDGERFILFGRGGLERATEILAERSLSDYGLLSTSRALAGAPPDLVGRARATHEVAAGGVPAAAAALVDVVDAPALVAFGGGRVIDVAKAVGAVREMPVAAIPTTLSGAEMTGIHRLPEGRDAPSGLIRPRLVIADPNAMTSAPDTDLRASAMNALAHGAEALYTPFANPVASMAALRGAGLIAGALDRDPVARDDLALGAILCGYAVDSAGLALHHVIAQSLVRTLETPHAATNAAILPRALAAMTGRAPGAIADLAAALGTAPDGLPGRIERLAGGRRGLGELGADRDRLEQALDVILDRPDLPVMTPDPPDRAELRGLILSAW